MQQLIARRGMVPRYVLGAAKDRSMDVMLWEARQRLRANDVPYTTIMTGSHGVFRVHPTNWRQGDALPAASSICSGILSLASTSTDVV